VFLKVKAMDMQQTAALLGFDSQLMAVQTIFQQRQTQM
jgi:hypothetical protein